MKLKKKVMAAILVVAITMSFVTPALAETKDLESCQTQEEMDNFSIRIEDAVFDTSILNEAAVDAIEQYTGSDLQGNFYIIDAVALQAELTAEQYDAVLTQIEVVNNQNEISTYATGSGTESDPYVLTDGVKASSYTTTAWFKCTTRGATDFLATSTNGATNTVYKKTLLGKDKLTSAMSKTLSTTISNCQINNNSNTYLVSMTSNTPQSLYCTITTHYDKMTSSTGGTWTPTSTTAIYDTNILYKKYWYVDKSRVATLKQIVEHEKFLDMQSKFVNGTLSISGFLLSLGIPETAIATGLASIAVTFIEPFNFKNSLLSDIDTAAGYNSSTNQFTKGILLKEYMYNGITCYSVETWTGSSMTGPKGWTGTWKANT